MTPTFLKRFLIALVVVTPVGLFYGGAVSQSRAASDLQYQLGTQGEYCEKACLGARFICCTIG